MVMGSFELFKNRNRRFVDFRVLWLHGQCCSVPFYTMGASGLGLSTSILTSGGR